MAFFSLRSSFRLARSILTKDQPVYVQFYVTARCNLACEQCNIIYANSDVSEIQIDGIGKIAENLKRIGVSIVLLTGGEPFVRKDLPEIVREFKKRDMHVRIQTNGLSSEASLEKCVEYGANDISISLDSIHPPTQDQVNGGYPGSWERAIEKIAHVNATFPSDAFAALGCVLAPRNMEHIPDLIRFASAIGWYVSLVPAHTTPMNKPMNFRSFDSTCRFDPSQYGRVREIIDEVRNMRDKGYLVYDSDEYLDDAYRLIAGEPVQWRERNEGVCDSPNLYFAILPNGCMSVCCDVRLGGAVSVASDDFPSRYQSDALRNEVHGLAAACSGCLYGSFPEMTITSRYFVPLLRRTVFFNTKSKRRLVKMSAQEMITVADNIRAANPRIYGG